MSEIEEIAAIAISFIHGGVEDFMKGRPDWAMVAFEDAISNISSMLALAEQECDAEGPPESG